MFEAGSRFLGKSEPWDNSWNPVVGSPDIILSKTGRDAVREAVFQVYPIHADDTRMRTLLELSDGERGPFFDRLRKEYPVRREFQNYRVRGGETESLRHLGFK